MRKHINLANITILCGTPKRFRQNMQQRRPAEARNRCIPARRRNFPVCSGPSSALAALCGNAFGRSLTARGDGTAAAADAPGPAAALGLLPCHGIVVTLESLPVEPVVAACRRRVPVVLGLFPAPRHGTPLPGVVRRFRGFPARPPFGAELLRALGLPGLPAAPRLGTRLSGRFASGRAFAAVATLRSRPAPLSAAVLRIGTVNLGDAATASRGVELPRRPPRRR